MDQKKEKLTEMLPFRVSPTMKRRLDAQARAQDRTVNYLVRKYIESGLALDEKRYRG